MSSWLFSLTEGDRVATAGPFGTFRVQDTEAEMVFIGGGVGMAPLRAMIFEQLEQRRHEPQDELLVRRAQPRPSCSMRTNSTLMATHPQLRLDGRAV